MEFWEKQKKQKNYYRPYFKLKKNENGFGKAQGQGMKGKLYGIGVGPGDPELITLKGLRIIKESDMIAVPGKNKETCTAYRIAKQAYPELINKKILEIDMPMTKDEKVLEQSHRLAADQVEGELIKGKQIAFLTLGDPTVYSTYYYIHKLVTEHGYDTEMVSGIPSFCAAAARLNIGLSEKAEALHIIPASYEIDEALKFSGTKVLMKAGKKLAGVKEKLLENEMKAVMVENCGMENERIYQKTEDINEQAGYYSLVIVKGAE